MWGGGEKCKRAREREAGGVEEREVRLQKRERERGWKTRRQAPF